MFYMIGISDMEKNRVTTWVIMVSANEIKIYTYVYLFLSLILKILLLAALVVACRGLHVREAFLQCPDVFCGQLGAKTQVHVAEKLAALVKSLNRSKDGREKKEKQQGDMIFRSGLIVMNQFRSRRTPSVTSAEVKWHDH